MATFTSRIFTLSALFMFIFEILPPQVLTEQPGDKLNLTGILTESRLYDDLLNNYNPHIRPSVNGPVLINVQFSPHTVDLDEHNMKFRIHGYLTKTWDDARLQWKPSDYNNLAQIRMPVQNVWYPDIVLYNYVDHDVPSMAHHDVLVLNSGSVYYVHRLVEMAVCAVDLAKFPFDTQICKLMYGSMVYNGLEVNISSHFNSLLTADYIANSKWELIDTSSGVTINNYACCAEPYPNYWVKFVLRRNSNYFSHVLIFPAMLIGALVPFLFLLPPDSKERITLGVALMMTTLLQVNVINDILPRHHYKIPIIIIYHILTLLWIALSLILSIFILNIYNRGPRRRKMPEIMRQIFLRSLRRLVCLGGDAYYPLDEQETVSMRGLDRTTDADVIVRTQDNPDTPKPEKDMDEIKKHIRSIALRGTVLEARHEIYAEWQQVALVIDRILCIFFLLTFLISTICLFA